MKVAASLFFIIFPFTSFAQHSIKPSDDAMYMKNSKTWNLGGCIVVGTGGAFIVKGVLKEKNKTSESIGDSPGFYYFVGGLTILTSIPFFITANTNKRRALLIKDQPQSTLVPAKYKCIPGITLSIQLNIRK